MDTVFYCTTLCFGLFTHRTQIAEAFTRQLVEGKRNITGDLFRQGTDPLTVMIDHCRRNNIEIFSSFRMNDIHDGAGFPEFFPQLKRDHRELLFGSEEHKPHVGYWTGVDYGSAEIREWAFRFIEEICKGYDIDGVELDFWRHMPYFRRHAWGARLTGEDLEQMTNLLRRIRKMTSGVAHDRGKPLLVGARVLESVSLSRDYGLDIVTWLQEGLVDMLITGELCIAPWEDLIQLGHQYDVPVYPCIRRSMASTEHNALESYRGQAAQAWKAGADGIYLFNVFPEECDPQIFRELGDPEVLKARTKLYSLDRVGVSRDSQYVFDIGRYVTRPLVSTKNPLRVKPGMTHRLPILLGDEVESPSRVSEILLRIRLADESASCLAVEPNELVVTVNGKRLQLERQQAHVHSRVPPTLVRAGYNQIDVSSAGSVPIAIHDVAIRAVCRDP